MIRRDERRRAVRIEVANLRVNQHGDAALVSQREDFREDARRDRTLIIIGNDESVSLWNRSGQNFDDAFFRPLINTVAPLAVCANDPLAVRDRSEEHTSELQTRVDI